MKILYAADDRHDALLAAGALRAVAPAASVAWAGRLPDAAAWLSGHRDIDLIVVDAEVQNQSCAPFVRHVRSLGVTTPILVVVPQTVSLPATTIDAGADEFVVKNQSLLPRMTAIVSRAIQREHADRRLREMTAENGRLRESDARVQKLESRLNAALTLLQQRDADVESAVERLRTREIELADAVQAQCALDERRAALQAALHNQELRTADERVAALRQAAEQRSAFETALAERVERHDALDRELAAARATLARTEERHALELSETATRFGERLEHELRSALDQHAVEIASAAATIAGQRAEFDEQLGRASAAHAALERSVADLTQRIESTETAAAAQLSHQEQKYETQLAEAASAQAIAGQRLVELEADLDRSRNERAAEAGAASARLTQLEAHLAERESAHREAEARAHDQHASLMEASAAQFAAQLAHHQQEHEAQLADAVSAHAIAGQRVFELEADLDRSRNERVADADAASARMAQLEAHLAERESAHREAEDRYRVELTAAAATHVALEQRIAGLQDQHASSMQASAAEFAAQLAHQQQEYEAQLDEAASAQAIAGQRVFELEADLDRSRNARVADADAASARVAQLEANLADLESAHREAEDRYRAELTAAAATQAALEQRIATLQDQHASSMEAAAAQQRQHDMQLADQTMAREAVEHALRDTVATLDRVQREYDSNAAAAAERLARREAEVAASAAARLAVEQRLADAEAALGRARDFANAERAAATKQAATQQAEFEAQLAREVEAREAVERDLVEERIAIERLMSDHAASLRDAQQSFSTLEGELRAALAAHSQQVDELNGELRTLTQELATTRNHRDALQLEAHRAPELARQLAASRARNRRQFEQSPVSMLRCGHDGALQDANYALVSALGYRSIDEVRAAGFPASVFETAEDFATFVQRGQAGPRQTGDFVLMKKDGGRLNMRLHVTLVSGDAIDIVAEDLTSLRAVEERLHQAHRMEAVGRVAAETAETCDTLLRNVSRSGHQLLAALGGDTPLRQEGEAIFADVTRAAGFLRQLSVYGHRQARASLPVDVIQVLRDVEPVLRHVAGDDVELVLPRKGSALNVDVDAERVERILVNVAAYGRARMPSGGRLIVELARVAVDRRFTTKYPNVREGGHALIRITEVKAARTVWPIGLREARPFAGEGAAVERPGVDLGALQGLIGDCGGHLWMNAEPGGNMEVKIRLPLRAPMAKAQLSRSGGKRAAMARWFQS